MEIHLYKFRFKSHNTSLPERDFNYFYEGIYRDAPPPKDGAYLVDAMRITDCLPNCISDVDIGRRTRDNVKTIETGRFTVTLDRQNAARSAVLNHNIDEFFATDYLRKRKVFCRVLKGNNKYEGFIDIPSINWDFTWNDQKDDIEFDVEDPMQEFLDAQKLVLMEAVGYNTRIAYEDYFASHHFAHFINNGSVTQVVDRLKLGEKLGGPGGRSPIISGPIQSQIIRENPEFKVYEASLSFSLGLCIMFKIESIDWDPAFQLQHIPFKVSYYLENDGLNTVEVENVHIHRRGYKWYNKQHVIAPYWKMDGPDYPGVSEFYFGLFMTADGVTTAFSDWNGAGANTPGILKYTTGIRKDRYEIQALGQYVNVSDTFLLDTAYPYNNLVGMTQVALNGSKPIYPAYCRILVTSFDFRMVAGQMNYVNDEGFPEIVEVTAKKALKPICGLFVETTTISVDFDEDNVIKETSEIIFEGKKWLVDRIAGVDVSESRAMIETVYKGEVTE